MTDPTTHAGGTITQAAAPAHGRVGLRIANDTGATAFLRYNTPEGGKLDIKGEGTLSHEDSRSLQSLTGPHHITVDVYLGALL